MTVLKRAKNSSPIAYKIGCAGDRLLYVFALHAGRIAEVTCGRSDDILAHLVGQRISLDGNSNFFHASVNALAPSGELRITRDNVAGYVALSCKYVHGAGRPFEIVGANDSIPWWQFFSQ